MDMAWAVNNLTVFAAASFNDTELFMLTLPSTLLSRMQAACCHSRQKLSSAFELDMSELNTDMSAQKEARWAKRSTPSLTRSMSPTPCKIAMAFSMDPSVLRA